jgi:hypothetical protein
MKLGADLVSRGHRYRPWRAGPRNYAHAGGGLARRREHVPRRAFREPVTPRERGAVRSEGMVRFRCQQTLLRAEPVMQPSGPNIVLLLVLTRFAGLAVGASGQAGSLPARGRRLWPAAERTTLAASPLRSLRRHRPRWPSLFMWPITGSMADRRRSSRLMTPKTPRFGERVAVIGVARQRLGVQHELAARGTAVGGHDRGLDAELIRR